MYCTEPANKKQKLNCDNDNETMTEYSENPHNIAHDDDTINQFSTKTSKSPILENKERSFKKCLKSGSYSVLKKLSRFPRTILDGNVVESKFFSSTEEASDNNTSENSITVEESPERVRNPFKKTSMVIEDSEVQVLEDLQKENSPYSSPEKRLSPILEPSPRSISFRAKFEDVQLDAASEESVIENTYPMETLITPTASQVSINVDWLWGTFIYYININYDGISLLSYQYEVLILQFFLDKI